MVWVLSAHNVNRRCGRTREPVLAAASNLALGTGGAKPLHNTEVFCRLKVARCAGHGLRRCGQLKKRGQARSTISVISTWLYFRDFSGKAGNGEKGTILVGSRHVEASQSRLLGCTTRSCRGLTAGLEGPVICFLSFVQSTLGQGPSQLKARANRLGPEWGLRAATSQLKQFRRISSARAGCCAPPSLQDPGARPMLTPTLAA